MVAQIYGRRKGTAINAAAFLHILPLVTLEPSRIRTRLKSPAPWALAGVLVLAAALSLLIADYAELRRDQRRVARELERLEARGFTREEIQTRLVEELASTRATVTSLIRERSIARAILEEHAGSVCLLHVAYRYVDARTGTPMAVVRPGRAGGVVLIHDVFGTAFPVTPRVLLSNRHVLEPWWQNPEAEAKAREGFVPEPITMRALCPTEKRPLAIELHDVGSDVDLATAYLKEGELDPLPIAPADRDVHSGIGVLMLGYPTALDAALARAPDEDRRALLPLLGKDPGALADSLLARNLVQPLLTYGRVSEVRSRQITFDAATAQGSSGGPLFNLRGEVIGVSSAILPRFAAVNFAIPLDSSNPLLATR